jgi:hypothetical protein
MMISNYQTQQEINRLIKKQLLSCQIKSIFGVIIGFTSLVITPLIAPDHQATRDKIINASGFTLGIIAFSYSLIINKSLRVLTGKARMIETLEKELFIDEQIEIFNQFKTHQLPPIDVTPTPIELNRTQSNENPNEPVKPLVHDTYGSSTNIELNRTQSNLDLPDHMIDNVILALQNGINDSTIIKDILGYKSEKYQQGKDVLDKIKKHLGVTPNA